jgi:HEAT repeat protein
MLWWKLRQLKSKDAITRVVAAEELGKTGNMIGMETLISALSDPDSRVRLRAAKALETLRYAPADENEKAKMLVANQKWEEAERLGTIAIEPLIVALKDSHLSVRKCAVSSLRRIGNSHAAEALITALSDSDKHLRFEAVSALREIGDVCAVEPLIAKLKDPYDYVCSRAVEALGEIGDKRAVEPLFAVLKDTYPYQYEEAAKALGKIGDTRAVEPLIDALKYYHYSHHSVVRQYILEALGNLGDQRAVEPIIAALRDANKELRDLKEDSTDVYHTRKEAVRALGMLGHSDAVEPLIAALKDPQKAVRDEAAAALSKIGDNAVEPLLAALRDSDSDVRKRASEALMALRYKPTDTTQRALILIANQDWDDAVKLGAIAVEPLIAVLRDSKSNMRREVASALEKIGKVAVEPLIIMLKDPNAEVRLCACSALRKIGDSRAVKPLITLLKDARSDVRHHAAEALTFLWYEPADETQRAVMLVANQKWDDAVKLGAVAVDPLIAVLKDYASRVKAAEALGKIADERAVQPLIEACTDHDAEVFVKALTCIGTPKAIQEAQRIQEAQLVRAAHKAALLAAPETMSKKEMVDAFRYKTGDMPDKAIVAVLRRFCIDPDPLLKPLVSDIGSDLWMRGGMSEMRRIFSLVGGTRELELAWDGTGGSWWA